MIKPWLLRISLTCNKVSTLNRVMDKNDSRVVPVCVVGFCDSCYAHYHASFFCQVVAHYLHNVATILGMASANKVILYNVVSQLLSAFPEDPCNYFSIHHTWIDILDILYTYLYNRGTFVADKLNFILSWCQPCEFRSYDKTHCICNAKTGSSRF